MPADAKEAERRRSRDDWVKPWVELEGDLETPREASQASTGRPGEVPLPPGSPQSSREPLTKKICERKDGGRRRIRTFEGR